MRRRRNLLELLGLITLGLIINFSSLPGCIKPEENKTIIIKNQTAIFCNQPFNASGKLPSER